MPDLLHGATPTLTIPSRLLRQPGPGSSSIAFFGDGVVSATIGDGLAELASAIAAAAIACNRTGNDNTVAQLMRRKWLTRSLALESPHGRRLGSHLFGGDLVLGSRRLQLFETEFHLD